jgi:hypothetical protein
MIFSLTTKDIKKLNDLNQVAKKVFKKYHIFPGGIIVCDENDSCCNKGIHFGITDEKVLCMLPENLVLSLSTETIFKVIKDRKKDIKYLKVDNHSLFLAGDDIEFLIGSVLPVEEINGEMIQLKALAEEGIKNCADSEDISVTLVDSLCNNELIVFNKGDGLKLRMTKELTPGIKNSFKVSVTMVGDLNDKSLFNTYIRVIRDNMITYHQYKCVRF